MTAKIVYYGPGLCGKTTNLNIIYARTEQRARGEMVSLNTETDRTLFFDLLPLEVGMVGGFKAKLQLYTVPGQVFYNSTRKLVLKGVDGIVFVADSQTPMLEPNRESLQNLSNNLRELGLDLGDIPMVFQWNKRDLKNVLPVPVLEAELNPRGFPSFQTVAQEGQGVFETLRGITRLALAQIKMTHLGESPAAKEASALERAVTPPVEPAPPPPPVQAPPRDPAAASATAAAWEAAHEALSAPRLEPPTAAQSDPGRPAAPGTPEAQAWDAASSSPVPLACAAASPTPIPQAWPAVTPSPTPQPWPAVTPSPVPQAWPAVTPSPVPQALPAVTPSPVPQPLPAVTPSPVPQPWDQVLPAPAPQTGDPAPSALASPFWEPVPQALTADDVVMADTQGEDTLGTALDALSFLDLPTASDLFRDHPELAGEALAGQTHDPVDSDLPMSASGLAGPGGALSMSPVDLHLSAAGQPMTAGDLPANTDDASGLADDLGMDAPLFPDDLPPLPFSIETFQARAAALNPGQPLASGQEAKAIEGAGQVMAPLTVKLRPPRTKVAGAPPSPLKPMAPLRPTAPLVAPRALTAPLRAMPQVYSLPNRSRNASVLRVTLPMDLGEGELEVTVVIRQNGVQVADGLILRTPPERGAASIFNLELKRP